ncbi:MAG: hypothetical protein A2402_00985 [Candidatus Staskawiczbacteria bacterium RIFOXYC1_FULL_37_43]|nr:MAG: hypothetical protein A2813_02305 [Candidatus Staskawiczbacteria bacterium RIFCSPHIGHO2_01_FULL_37_17]OGZ71657.1 MAG: hypothetical protein A2891_00385 [Candidatus Staskawiczbacteria bacterium RIFCSPLOWO2_01_FULL_37_19]OGZ76194.1 MAG: hypothetical protein A2205_04060 [Candidatus Staskawiczbacteria bacterium RIFOXYA1_FULL_37_15]OGZ77060.1 MAG: hypothetical protein A2280_01060 [Candidatus Staskawiczbacteria bacterium RIFOXYA12_FULL_37_10]OGZ80163.1 MAG: hypothetical protein A2353_02775 [Can
MTDLLPPEEKKSLKLEQTKNLVIVFAVSIIIALVCLILILLSIEFYILSQINSQKFVLDSVEAEYQSSDFLEYKQIIEKYNEILPGLFSFYKKEIPFTNVFDVVLDVPRPEGLVFDKIYIERSDTPGKIKAVVFGFSDNRENLLLFQKNVKQERKLKNVSFSTESWINPVNTNFSFTFEYGN